jgi:hypothetical protein
MSKISSDPRIGPFTTMMFENAGYQTVNQLRYFDTCHISDDYQRFVRDTKTLEINQEYTNRFWRRMITRCMNIINLIQNVNAIPVSPEFMVCCISGCIMEEPVILPNGKSCERCEIEEWIDSGRKCPFTGEPLLKDQLISNRNLQDVLEDYNKHYAGYVLSFDKKL